MQILYQYAFDDEALNICNAAVVVLDIIAGA
jgi:hypothetical protein